MVSTCDLTREIKRRNPSMTLDEIARICGVTKQAVHHHLQKPTETRQTTTSYVGRYEADVAYVRKVIPQRGRIWEGARPGFEAGTYHDESLARMLAEGVIVPSDDPKGGYVLP
jgi:predicted transcriptional regulator